MLHFPNKYTFLISSYNFFFHVVSSLFLLGITYISWLKCFIKQIINSREGGGACNIFFKTKHGTPPKCVKALKFCLAVAFIKNSKETAAEPPSPAEFFTNLHFRLSIFFLKNISKKIFQGRFLKICKNFPRLIKFYFKNGLQTLERNM